MRIKNKFKDFIGWQNPKGSFCERIKKFLSWDADIALRYYPVVEFLNKHFKETVILEVGSGPRGLANYVKKEIVGVDVDFSGVKLVNLKMVVGSIFNLPFKNGSFDVVVCIDVLEHIEEGRRIPAIRELLRVSSGFVIIGAPCGENAAELDRIINQKYKNVSGRLHPYIIQHLKFGLPDLDKYLNLLNGDCKIIKVVQNTPLSVWRIVNLYCISVNSLVIFLKNLIFRVLFPVVSRLKGRNYYRKIYFLKKCK